MGVKRLEVRARRLTDRTLNKAAAGDRRTLEQQVLADDVVPADDKALAHSAAEFQSAAVSKSKSPVLFVRRPFANRTTRPTRPIRKRRSRDATWRSPSTSRRCRLKR